MSYEKTTSPENSDLLKKANVILAEFGCSKLDRLPAPIKNTEALKGKTMVMVDDGLDILGAFVPDLTVATDGNTSFIHYSEETGHGMGYAIEKILEANPDVVLMDYYLSERINGGFLAQYLRREGFGGTIIGFSSNDIEIAAEFQKAGVPETVKKDRYSPSISIRHLAEVLSQK